MLDTFIYSFKLKNTYKVNTIIYSIKQLPLIKKLLPESLYKSPGLKVLGNIVSAIFEFGSIFFGKAAYIFLMLIIPVTGFYENNNNAFFHLILFLTIAGMLLNTYMFNPTKHKYYAMFLMRVDARKYTLSDYIYTMLKTIVGFFPFCLIAGFILDINIIACLVIPVFVAACKTMINAYYVYRYKTKEEVYNENKPVKNIWLIAGAAVALAYGLPFAGITINATIFLIIAAAVIAVSVFALLFLFRFDNYKLMYKKILTGGNMNTNIQARQIQKESYLSHINNDIVSSNKKGYKYFNEVFIRRHSKILYNSVKKMTLIICILIVGIIAAVLFIPEIKEDINSVVLNYLPYMVFIMYIINRGQGFTHTLFMNCDHSMLTYSFYRSPRGILGLFRERLKSIILINLMPASVIAAALPVLLYITGGTNNFLNYIVLFVSVISMSIFFSIHHLVLYYLLQPYNVQSETKSSLYAVCNMLTYMVCWFMIQITMPTIVFGAVMIGFVLVYSAVALLLAYKKAPKTFKLRI